MLENDAPIILAAPAVRVRHGKEVRLLLQEPGTEDRSRNPHLVSLLREAAEAKTLIDASGGLSISEIATRAGRCRSYLAKLYRIAHLAPELVQLVMTGRQPTHLTTRMLLNAQLPLAWNEQCASPDPQTLIADSKRASRDLGEKSACHGSGFCLCSAGLTCHAEFVPTFRGFAPSL
jgi:hypothetical protein